MSPNDVTAAFSRILGKPVAVVQAPLDAIVPTFTSFGASENIATLFREMYQGMADGKIVPEPAPRVRAAPPLSKIRFAAC